MFVVLCRASVASAGLALLGAPACEAKQRPLELTDSEGRRFRQICIESTCRYERASGQPVAPEKAGLQLSTLGRVVGICDVASGSATEPGDCRPLLCEHDRQCPALHGLEAGHCVNGLCISPDQELNASDAVLLCLAGTGLGLGAPKQVERYAMALNCGDPCRVPAPCRQP